MTGGTFHVKVNVTDFDRPVRFYERLRFRIVRDLGEGGTEHLERGLGFENRSGARRC